MDISGVVNLYVGEYRGIKYYLFSDIHIPMISLCGEDRKETFTDFLNAMFEENKDSSIDFYLENRFYVDGDNNFVSEENSLMIPTIFSKFRTCFRHIDKGYECFYPHVSFYNVDIRYGHKYGDLMQRTVFSFFEQLCAKVKSSSNRSIVTFFLSFVKLLNDSYWSIVEFYLVGSSYSQLQLPELIEYCPVTIPYEEIMVENVSINVYQLAQLNMYERKQVSRFTWVRFEENKRQLNGLVSKVTSENIKKFIDEIHTLSLTLLFCIFDCYVLSRLLETTADMKILYVGGRHIDTYVEFFRMYMNTPLELFGTPNTDNVIANIMSCRLANPRFMSIPMHELLYDKEFAKIVKKQVSTFQCIRDIPTKQFKEKNSTKKNKYA